MAIKSVIEIQVDDTDFQRFQKIFNQYSAGLTGTVGTWQNVGQAATTATAQTGAMATATGTVASNLHNIVLHHAQVSRHVQTQDRSWQNIARSSTTFAGKIVEATRSLLRWGGIMTALTGVMGLGGLFGIERLASSAGN